MKNFILSCLAALAFGTVQSQNLKPVEQKIADLKKSRVEFQPAELFKTDAATRKQSLLLERKIQDAVALKLNGSAIENLFKINPQTVHINLPAPGNKMLELELYRSNIFTPDFSVITATSGNQPVAYKQGLHFHGIVKGEKNSLAAISVFETEVAGLISVEGEGNYVLGKLENSSGELHVIYPDRNLRNMRGFVCSTPEDNGTYDLKDLQQPSSPLVVNCIRLYWEVNYDIFQNKGSVANATNHVTSVFNQSAIIYSNDNIPVELSQVFVWDVTSPYTSTTTSGLLGQFQSYRNSFNGDLGHLLGLAGGGGVAAGFSGLCASNLDNSQCYSGISSSYQNFPTYSWSVEVVTHEQGHLMGSRHTHACVWNGNNTAIDNCGPTAGYAYEGSCSGAPTPVGGGTIMSYCHLVSGVGINFNNGFGTQPKNVILNKYNAASCLVACGGSACGIPAGLNATNITSSTVTLNWGSVTNATSYNLQYKTSASGTWITISGIAVNTNNLSGLQSSTQYDFRVESVCSSGSSGYSSTANFTTAAPPCNTPTGLGSTNITTTGATVSWGAVSGAVSYTLRYYVAGTQNFITVTGITTTNYMLTGLQSSTAYNFQVMTVCQSGSSSYSAVASFTTLTPCTIPSGLTSSNITSSSATVAWNPVSGASSYSLQYKLTSSSNYTTISGLVNTSNNLTGLSASSSYDFRVQANCSSGASGYSPVSNFTTLAAVCTDNYEPNNSSSAATPVSFNIDYFGLIYPKGDIDIFKFNNSTAQPNIRVTLTNLPANYDLRLMYGGVAVANSSNTGTSSETINYNTSTVGTYRVRVIGTGSTAFNQTACYTMRVITSANPFRSADSFDADIDGEEISMFPNPARDHISILVPPTNTVQVEIFDALGKCFATRHYENPVPGEPLLFPVESIPAGMYIIRIQTSREVKNSRLIIAK